ncbi:MAG: LapA family protein [Cryomorphaceae bacterium]|nr:MAG: LapA family protein [Cryomorphaceae bacterium]
MCGKFGNFHASAQMQKGLVIALILAVLLIVFALQNTSTVGVNLWFWRIESSMALLVIILLAAGVLIGLLATLPTTSKRKQRIKELEDKLRKMGGEQKDDFTEKTN